MSGETKIGWTELTWNVGAYGCVEVSPGCDNCYARVMHNKWNRLVREETDPTTGRTRAVWIKNGKPAPLQYLAPFGDVRLMNPASTDKKGRPGILTEQQWLEKLRWPHTVKKPSMIFVNSMLDWLISDLPLSDIQAILNVCEHTPQHVYQFLTKRTGRLRHVLPQLRLPPNVWIGQSIEADQFVEGRLRVFDERGDRAWLRFLSVEPLLSDLPSLTPHALKWANVDWVIVGAESGRGARPMNEDWVRRIRDACGEAGVAFFYKQSATPEGRKITSPVLDGRTWEEWPELVRCVGCNAVYPKAMAGPAYVDDAWGIYECDGPKEYVGTTKGQHFVCYQCVDGNCNDATGKHMCSDCAAEYADSFSDEDDLPAWMRVGESDVNV